jgi:hypothetical protein
LSQTQKQPPKSHIFGVYAQDERFAYPRLVLIVALEFGRSFSLAGE